PQKFHSKSEMTGLAFTPVRRSSLAEELASCGTERARSADPSTLLPVQARGPPSTALCRYQSRDPCKKGIQIPSNMQKRRILVVDDHPLLRAGLIQFIERQEDMICCGEADSAATTQGAVANQKPDLVLLDLRLRSEDGLELIKSLKARFPKLPVLIISQCDEL